MGINKKNRKKAKKELNNFIDLIYKKENETIKELKKSGNEKEIEKTIERNNLEIKRKKEYYRERYCIKRTRLIFPLCFVFLIVLSTFTFVRYRIVNGYFDSYDTYKEQKVDYRNTFAQKENEYYVYIYKENCSACTTIKNEVFKYARNGNKKIYFLNISESKNNTIISSDLTSCVGATTFDNLKVQYTPTLILIEEGICTKSTYGGESVVAMLQGKMTNGG